MYIHYISDYIHVNVNIISNSCPQSIDAYNVHVCIHVHVYMYMYSVHVNFRGDDK